MVDIRHFFNTKYVMILNQYEFEKDGQKYTIPQGFFFDGGSIPRIFWAISHPFFYKYLEAFLIHDFFYSNYFLERVKDGVYKYVSRDEADQDFKKRLKDPIIARYFYLAVKYFGWITYGQPLHINKNDYEDKTTFSNKK